MNESMVVPSKGAHLEDLYLHVAVPHEETELGVNWMSGRYDAHDLELLLMQWKSGINVVVPLLSLSFFDVDPSCECPSTPSHP